MKLTIVTRTSSRPKAFSECRASLLSQKLPPELTITHLVTCDNEQTKDYVQSLDNAKAPIEILEVSPKSDGAYWNLYMNDATSHLSDRDTWIIFLDDDNTFVNSNSLLQLYDVLKKAASDIFYLCKYYRGDTLKPYLNKVQLGQVDTACIIVHSSYATQSQWVNRFASDFHYIEGMSKIKKVNWLKFALIVNKVKSRGKKEKVVEHIASRAVLPKQEIKNNSVNGKVNSFNIEFGYELISVLPYAYKLYKDGKLSETESAIDTDPFYFFSPNHKINNTTRAWNNMHKAWQAKIPNIGIHSPDLDLNNFSPPPLKEKYRNGRFVFKKPILCICNRINVEWGKAVINYFDKKTLTHLFSSLKSKYQIVYFNIAGKEEYYDGAEPIDIGDYKLARKNGVIVIHDLALDNSDLSFNELQLMVMANCERFITLNGGYSILASYMGGTNIIYSKECREIKPEVNSFNRWYDLLGGSNIIHVDNYHSLFEMIDYLDKPLVNILVRTHNRPNYFRNCYNSIINQTYKNVKIVVSTDNKQTHEYVIPYRATAIQCTPSRINSSEKKKDYGHDFPFNHYWKQLKDRVTQGWIMGLDDDDRFIDNDCLEKIISKIKNEDELLLWRVKFGDRKVPGDENFGKNIVARDISGIGFMCHSKHLKHEFLEPFRRADYRLINRLSKKLKVVWIDDIFTGPQSGSCGMGTKHDLPN